MNFKKVARGILMGAGFIFALPYTIPAFTVRYVNYKDAKSKYYYSGSPDDPYARRVQGRHIWRFRLLWLGVLAGGLSGMIYGAVGGAYLGTLILPGAGTILFGLLGLGMGAVYGCIFGAAAGVLTAKFLAKTVSMVTHLKNKVLGRYANSYPPVKIGNRPKYRPHEEPQSTELAGEKLYTATDHKKYTTAEIRALFAAVYQLKKKNMGDLSYKAHIYRYYYDPALENVQRKEDTKFYKNVPLRDREILARNDDYNTALAKLRALDFACMERKPGAGEGTEYSTDDQSLKCSVVQSEAGLSINSPEAVHPSEPAPVYGAQKNELPQKIYMFSIYNNKQIYIAGSNKESGRQHQRVRKNGNFFITGRGHMAS